MPKENKKRGRREEKKRRREEEEELGGNEEEVKLDRPTKHQRTSLADQDMAYEAMLGYDKQWDPNYTSHGQGQQEDYGETGCNGNHDEENGDQHEFYGLLTEDEQAYFKNADNMLELNQFSDPEDRKLFLESVWREVNGKELKVANSQSSSRFLERLIRLSTPAQLKMLFQKFQTHFLFLVQHRFASHCCEALFLQAAPVVTEELVAPIQEKPESEGEEEAPSMEELFVSTVAELEANMGYLTTDNFASHTLRVLLVVLSGKRLDDWTTVLRSKKKEKIEISNAPTKKEDTSGTIRAVPSSFSNSLSRMIACTVGSLDTNYLRALATQPVANPVLQLLVEIEFAVSGKQKAKDDKSLFRKLLPDEVPEEGTQSAAFIKGLLYDPVGARLLEVIVRNAPGKTFKAIYRIHFKENIQGIVRNEVASFVAIRVLARLNHDNLQEMLSKLYPEFSELIERSRFSVLKAIIEQARYRDVDTKEIENAIAKVLGHPGAEVIPRLLTLSDSANDDFSADRKAELEAHNSSKRHASLLMQNMIAAPDALRRYVLQCLRAMDPQSLFSLSKDRAGTHIVQAALGCGKDEEPFYRQFVPNLNNHIADLAIDPVGSHVVDSLWTATEGFPFLREAIAEKLAASEMTVRDSYPGRIVWRNWMMDIYQRRKSDWINKWKNAAKSSYSSTVEEAQGRPQTGRVDVTRGNHATGSNPIGSRNVSSASMGRPKTAIDLARERHVAKKAAESRAPRGRQTGQTVTAT